MEPEDAEAGAGAASESVSPSSVDAANGEIAPLARTASSDAADLAAGDEGKKVDRTEAAMPTDDDLPAVDPRERRKHICQVATFIIVALVIAVGFAYFGVGLIVDMKSFLDSMGPWGPWFLCILYVFWITLFMPPTALDLLAGFTYGFTWRPIFAAILGKIGAYLLSFAIGERLLKEYVQREIMSKYQIMRVLNFAMEQRPYQCQFLLRFAVLPATCKSYGASALPKNMPAYVLAGLTAAIFTSLMFINLGSTADDLGDLVSGENQSVEEQIVLLVGIVSIFVFVCVARSMTKHTIAQESRRYDESESARSDQGLMATDPPRPARMPSTDIVLAPEEVEMT